MRGCLFPFSRRTLLEHGVAREAEANARFDQVNHGLFLIGKGDALGQYTQRPEYVVNESPMRRSRRCRDPGQGGKVGPVLTQGLVAPFGRRDHAVVVGQQRRELEFATFDLAFGSAKRASELTGVETM